MTNINPRTQDLIDFIKSKYNINPVVLSGRKMYIYDYPINNDSKYNFDYHIFETKDKIELKGIIKNNTNSTKFLTFVLNPNTSMSFLDINQNGDEKKTDNDSNKDKEELVSVREDLKRYKLISYVLGVITMITIIVIIYLLFIK